MCSQAMAQLVLSPLNYNPRLYYSTAGSQAHSGHQYKNFTIVEDDTLLVESDTLSLPFVDDFTYPSLKPYSFTGIYDTIHNVIGPCDTNHAWTIATVTDTFSFNPTYTYSYDTATKSIDSVPNAPILFYNAFASDCFYSGDTAHLYPRGYINVYDTINGAITFQIFDTTNTIVAVTYAPVLYKAKAPANTKWLDNNVYQNYTSAYLPPTLGVATFDGLNSQGRAYNNSSPNNWGLADILTSKPIHLSDTLGNDLSDADSIYLSFFYQPGGFGYDAVVGDSLVLQFYNKRTDNWDWIWSTTGDSIPTIPPAAPDAFRQVIMRIPSSTLGPPVRYICDGFQFRFLSYGPLTGGVDIWNLDYVRLDKNRNSTDTSINDVAFQYQYPSILKNYSEMPIEQYTGTVDMADTIALYVDNLNPTQASTNPPATPYTTAANETFPSTSIVMSPLTNTFNAGLENTLYLFPNTQYTPPSTTGDTMMVIRSQSVLNNPDILAANDTIGRDQVLYNTLAYDDGTAELAVGVTNLFSPTNKFAYDFTLNQPDTLVGFQVMFGNVNIDVSQLVFNFNLWYSLDTNNVFYADTPVYTTNNLVPYYSVDSVNGYTTYRIPPVYLPTHFYFGWSQADVNNLQVGYDVNSTKGYQHIYFYANGVWQNASIDAPLSPPGSPMIRLLLGHSNLYTSGIKNMAATPVKVYPNPTTGLVTFDLPDGGSTYNVEFYSMVGQLSFNQTISNANNVINIGSLDPGVYLIRMTDNASGIVYQNKIVKSEK